MQGVRILRGNDRSAELTRCYDRLNAYKMRALIHPAERSRLGISAAVKLIQSRPWDGIFAVNNALAHIHHKVGLPYILAADYLAVCVADIDIRIDSPRELSSRNAHKHGGVLVPPLERIALLDKGSGSLRDVLRILLQKRRLFLGLISRDEYEQGRTENGKADKSISTVT